MCLDVIIKKDGFPKNGIGYKLFRLTPTGKLKHLYRGTKTVKEGVWLTAKKKLLGSTRHTFDFTTYMSGFHLYTSSKACQSILRYNLFICPPIPGRPGDYCKRTVKYKNAKVVGMQNGDNVIVADKILIIRPKCEQKRT